MFDILENIDFQPFKLSFELAIVTTTILFSISIPIAWYLSQTKSRYKPLMESLVALPIVLPPSVLGFYLLMMLSQNSTIGLLLKETFDITLVFSFTGLVIASCFYSLPFMIQPLQGGFESLDRHIIEASYISGKSRLQTLLRVAMPNIKPSMLTAIVITFAHTVGEFGVVLMVGGSITDETRVASVAIYEMVETMDYETAHIYSGIMIVMSFAVLLMMYMFNRKYTKSLGV